MVNKKGKEIKMKIKEWEFRCALGLLGDTCEKYEHDPDSRGAVIQGTDGCMSCIHRVPDNPDTELAEDVFPGRTHRLSVDIPLSLAERIHAAIGVKSTWKEFVINALEEKLKREPGKKK